MTMALHLFKRRAEQLERNRKADTKLAAAERVIIDTARRLTRLEAEVEIAERRMGRR